ncbi:4150_t:CDS:2 [Entrophospora sp. SA101]|nr:4150_t:CDS:2 [Entrophospora sp. SA101]
MDLWSNLAIAGNILKTKPLQFSDKLHIEDLSVSVGWLAKFKERFHIKQYHKAGETNSVPLETLDHYNHITNKIPESLVKEIILKLNPHTIAAKFLYSPGWIRPAPPKSDYTWVVQTITSVFNTNSKKLDRNNLEMFPSNNFDKLDKLTFFDKFKDIFPLILPVELYDGLVFYNTITRYKPTSM